MGEIEEKGVMGPFAPQVGHPIRCAVAGPTMRERETFASAGKIELLFRAED